MRGHKRGLHRADGRERRQQNRRRHPAPTTKARAQGANVDTAIIDVTDKDAMSAWMRARDEALAVDLIIANAGISGGTGGVSGGESDEQLRKIFDVNVTLLLFAHQQYKLDLAKSSGLGKSSQYHCPEVPAFCSQRLRLFPSH